MDREFHPACPLPTVLHCGDCHQPEVGGRLMVPVSMEQHCQRCHSLAFEPEVTKRQVQGMARIHPPETQRAHTPALDQPLPLQLLESEMHRTRGPCDPADELARMEFLTRRARQQRK